jgi:hypothetical protein
MTASKRLLSNSPRMALRIPAVAWKTLNQTATQVADVALTSVFVYRLPPRRALAVVIKQHDTTERAEGPSLSLMRAIVPPSMRTSPKHRYEGGATQ